MHITLLSACEKKAWARSRAILDSYAQRIGPRTWKTPITAEGLDELRLLLRKKASRHTRVACFRNQGAQDMRLLWHIGDARSWTHEGLYRVAQTQTKPRPPSFLQRYCALLASLQGYAHDLGKASSGFQEKLRRAIAAMPSDPNVDPVHHSLLSMAVLPELLKATPWESAWKITQSKTRLEDTYIDFDKLTCPLDIAQFGVGTHHFLFPDAAQAQRHYFVGGFDTKKTQPVDAVGADVLRTLGKTYDRLTKAHATRPLTADQLKGVAIFSRAALVLADHLVSNPRFGSKSDTRARALANTRTDHKTGRSKHYQTLDFHLDSVGKYSGDLLIKMLSLRLPGLSPMSRQAIDEPSQAPHAWQNSAVERATHLRQTYDGPVLVFNCAATGSGKTLANVKILNALNPHKARISIALNLRTLTLQTGHALRNLLGVGQDELATVIGDRVIERLHRGSHFYEGNLQADASGVSAELPSWCEAITRKQPGACALQSSPILVSTIDFLIDAGNPGRQGHHVSALLRLLHSDLVLDEIDNYEPKALGAVLRLVFMAGLCGKNLVCSSATLPDPIAQAINHAFFSGVRAGHGLTHFHLPQDGDTNVLLVTNRAAPRAAKSCSLDYLGFVHNAKPEATPTKLAQVVPGNTVAALYEQIYAGAQRLHQDHGQRIHGKNVSFGLVRVANIDPCIDVAKGLAKSIPHARVCAYHSNLLLIERFLKERRLDTLLHRKSESHLALDPEIKRQIQEAPGEDVIFVVVATPVEEIGRDHDFDWAIIEPSSLSSIIQTAGRVNRHRQAPVSAANVLILEHNFRWAKKPQDPCFRYPGLELNDSNFRYSSPNVATLLGKAINEPFVLDGQLRFDASLPFCADENRLIRDQLHGAIDALDPTNPSWMSQGLYQKYALRSGSSKTMYQLSYNDERFALKRLEIRLSDDQWLSAAMRIDDEKIQNAWLDFDIETLIEACNDNQIPLAQGLGFDLLDYGAQPVAMKTVVWNPSFGFRYEK